MRVVGRGNVEVNALKGVDVASKLGSEVRVSIGQNAQGSTDAWHDGKVPALRPLQSRPIFASGDERNFTRETVRDSKDAVEGVECSRWRRWELDDEVDSNHVPGSLGVIVPL